VIDAFVRVCAEAVPGDDAPGEDVPEELPAA
jgi:hypothetical protein